MINEQIETEILLKKNAINFLAKRIIDKGPSTYKGQYCLIPEEFVDNTTEFNKISTFLFETNKVTHYDLKWEEPLKTVRVRLYAGKPKVYEIKLRP